MSLSAGTRVGPYEITSQIGAGGMGEVYRARDTRLKRDVALKILPESFATDPDRLARFQREAEVLASLSHPNIAGIYGLEESDGIRALVMELVEGEDLSQRIARGPIPLDEALPIARQIAEALEAAHEQGIIHRDLKTANIKITPDGRVKVLDFGLAKLTESSAAAVNPSTLSMSPTITSPAMTGVGMLLGTAAYMSPEQARGKPADKRSDIWAFGCVLYEMLTGTRAFEGEDVSDTFANVLKADPNWAALPSRVPESIRALLRACLEKNRRERTADIAAAILILRDPTFRISSAPKARRPVWRTVLAAAAAGLVCAATVGALVWRLKPAAVPLVTRFEVALGDRQEFAATAASRRLIAISPDGSQIAYVANARIYVRPLSQLEARPLASTEEARGVQNPVFSPDGKSIAFYSVGDNALKRVAVSGGGTVNLCATTGINGLTWNDSGIVFSVFNKGVMRVNPAGGVPERLVQVQSGEAVVQPQLLPGGRSILFTLADQSGVLDFDRSRIVVQSLTTGERKTLIERGTDAWYVPTGHILYALGGVLWAVPFDLERLEVTGGPVSMIEGVARGFGAVGLATAQFSVSSGGSLAYIPGPATPSGGLRNLVSIDRTGAVQPLRRQAGAYQTIRVSPDGSRLAMVVDDGKDANVWIDELAGGNSIRRLTFEGRNRYPIWSGDGRRIIFQSDREGDLGIWWQNADGSGPAERLTKADRGAAHIPESWLPRQQMFSFSLIASPGSVSLWTFSIPTRKAAQFDSIRSTAPFDSVYAPNGRWLAYTQRAPGVASVFVQPVPPSGAKYEVAQNGHHPLWSPDGTRLLYFPGADRLVSVRVSTQSAFTVGNAEPVPGGMVSNTSNESGRNHDFTPDGLIVALFTPSQMPGGGPATQHIEVVLNWFRELEARAQAK